MEFSEKEVHIIKSAEKSVKSAKIIRSLILIVLCSTVVAFFFGKIPQDALLYVALGAPILALLVTQMGPAPKYEQLAAILSNKLNN